MSTTVTITPPPQSNRYNQNKITFMNHTDPDQSPIKRYMRQNNFQMLIQEESKKKGSLAKSQANEIVHLKQFEKSLEKETLAHNQHITNNKKTNQAESVPPTPKRQIKKQPIENEKDENRAVKYRASQTQHYGDEIMNKLKNFIVQEDSSKRRKSPIRMKIQQSPYCISSSIQKLHNDHKRKQATWREQYSKKQYHDDLKQLKQYKVTNPTSLYLIQRHMEKQIDHKPIYERAIELAKKKQQQILERQFQKEQQKQARQEQEYAKYQEIRKQKYASAYKKEKQQQFYKDLANKQKMKNQVKQHQKMTHLKQITKQKPYVSKVSKQLFNKILQRDELSRQFLQRNIQYRAERQKQKLKQMKDYQKQYTPFSPQITEASRQLAQKYYRRKERDQLVSKFNLKKQNKGGFSQRSNKNQMSSSPNKHSNKSQSPIKRPISAHILKNKNKSSNNKSNIKEIQRFQPQTNVQIPIYNQSNYLRKRTNSCFNVSCRK